MSVGFVLLLRIRVHTSVWCTYILLSPSTWAASWLFSRLICIDVLDKVKRKSSRSIWIEKNNEPIPSVATLIYIWFYYQQTIYIVSSKAQTKSNPASHFHILLWLFNTVSTSCSYLKVRIIPKSVLHCLRSIRSKPWSGITLSVRFNLVRWSRLWHKAPFIPVTLVWIKRKSPKVQSKEGVNSYNGSNVVTSPSCPAF